jgi:hypothetical protein
MILNLNVFKADEIAKIQLIFSIIGRFLQPSMILINYGWVVPIVWGGERCAMAVWRICMRR